MPGKFSFRDSGTGVLKAWGYVASNALGDIAQAETDSFTLAPGQWQWNGSAWVPFSTGATPDPVGFIADVRSLFASSATTNWAALINAHPAFGLAVINRDYPTIEQQLNAARAAAQIGNGMWTAITTFVTNRNLPIVLSS